MIPELPAATPDPEYVQRLDPGLREEFVRLVPVDVADPAGARAAMARRVQAQQTGAPSGGATTAQVHRVERSAAEGGPVEVTVYRRLDAGTAPLPCVYWIHGGGHVMGAVEQDDALLREMCSMHRCVVIAVEWRHAPEHPFPAALEDCRVGLEWTFSHAPELGVDHNRFVLGGASSGGGLAAGLALMLRDRGGPAISFQLLVYPMLDDRNALPSTHSVSDHRTWNRRSNLIAWRHYLGGAAGTDGVSPYAAPARATDLGGLPPAFVTVGELDLFRDEDIAYAQRLLAAGVATEVHVYPGLPHGAMRMSNDVDVVRRFNRDRDDALRAALARSLA